MNYLNMQIFKNLPLDCVNYILSYDNRFSIRRGIIVNKLTDKRYTPLLSVPNKFYMHGNMHVNFHVNINKDFRITCRDDIPGIRRFTFIIISYVFDDDIKNILIDYPTIKKICIDF